MNIKNTLIAGILLTGFSVIANAAYNEIEVANGASISGKVSFGAADPAPKIYAITKDNDVCGTGNREIDFVKVKDGGLSDVVVYLDKMTQGKAFPEQKGTIVQKACEFIPFMSVMHNKSTIDAVNEDSVLHNIHTYEIIGRAKKTAFNVSQPDTGTITKTVTLKRGVAMKVECDAHDFMHGFVFVAKSPYYALVAEDGTFTIDNVPPGTYAIKAFHGTLGEKKGKVTVAENGSASFDFAY